MAKQTTKKKPSKSNASKKKNDTAVYAARRTSVWMFAAALFLGLITYLKGEGVWTAVRSAFFGVFGWSLYLMTPVVIYLAILVAARKPWRIRLTEVCVILLIFSAVTMLCFGNLQIDSFELQTFGSQTKVLYQQGCQGGAGCVMAVPLGLTLLRWTGRGVAIALLILLLIVFVMLLTDVTPHDVFRFVRTRADAAGQEVSVEREIHAARRSERQAQREQLEAEISAKRKQQLEERLAKVRPHNDPHLPEETADKPRGRWDIDVNLPQTERVEPATAEEKAQAVPLKAVKGEAFDPQEHRNLEGVLNHDVLAQAGRSALTTEAAEKSNLIRRPTLFDQDAGKEETQPETSQNTPHQPILFDQDEKEDQYVGLTLSEQQAFFEKAQELPTEGKEQSTEAAEVDDLIRRALDGRAAGIDDSIPDNLPLDEQALPVIPQTKDSVRSLFEEAQPEKAAAPLQETAAPVQRVLPPYHLPGVELLDRQPPTAQNDADAELRQNAMLLVNTLDSFGVKTKILDICRGPSVTRYELQPLAGVKISRITNLADDIALNLASGGVRIEAPIPGKPSVGIEVPNKVKTTVSLRSILQSEEFTQSKAALTMCLGKDIAGSVKLADLARMPHLLIAGSTGSGKSVCINSIIMSFLYKSTPDELRMILIDPKVVELAEYNGIPHLLMPVVTEPRKAAGALGSAVAEMERRYQLFAANNVRDIKSFNQLSQGNPALEKLPYVAIIIDELADLMMVAGKQVEDYICRIAQKARAAGMHLIVATQRPSVDVITGLIKANIPSRIAFAVSSQVDSRTILDSAGAEKLLGMGDMLFLPVGAAKPTRIQGTFVKDSEIERVIGEIKSYADARYDEEMIAEAERRASAADGGNKEPAEEEDDGAQDPMLRDAIETVVDAKMASTSLLQRKLKLGYARAARIMDQMEALHIIGPYEGSKPRQVLISHDQFVEMTMRQDS